MILVDYREKPGRREKSEIVDLIRRFGVKAETADLPFGDFAFEGYDSKGSIAVGVERKRLHDMLQCVEDRRYNSHQRIGMLQLYDESWLLLEGVWRPHDPKGLLMEGNDRGQYWECRPGGRATLYAKLRRYLFSISRSGVEVMYTRDVIHSAYDVCELYHYYSKRDHVSLISKQKMNIPSLNGRPSLCRRWAEELDGVGPKKADLAVQLFKNIPARLADSEELEWLGIPGIGPATAMDIVRQITGGKR